MISPRRLRTRHAAGARRCVVLGLALTAATGWVDFIIAQEDGRPAVPAVQVIPLPEAKAAFEEDGRQVAVYHFGPNLKRPFVFPVIGPSGRSLTRMGHPHDPESHSHHNSVWISHNHVNGDDFWGDRGSGRIVHQRIIQYTDGNDEAAIVSENHWLGTADRVQLTEIRRLAARPLENGRRILVIDLLLLAPENQTTTLGQTAFGLIGVRMAKTIGVHDGGGTIRNSEGNINEQGPNGCFRKPARWVDYSGLITNTAVEGITLMDQPQNNSHPTPFHVRADGWMGASLTLNGPIKISQARPLRLRYGILIHSGDCDAQRTDEDWRRFAKEPLAELPMPK